MRKLLRGFDVELEEAQNGEMAVAYFEKGNTCDLIFMDKDMPIMDGYEVVCACSITFYLNNMNFYNLVYRNKKCCY